MQSNHEFTDSSELVAVRLPKDLRAEARRRARSEDLNFSQLMRRALRRDLGFPIEEKPTTTEA